MKCQVETPRTCQSTSHQEDQTVAKRRMKMRLPISPKKASDEERLLFLTNRPGDFLPGKLVDGFRITGVFEAEPELVIAMVRGQVSEACYEVWGYRAPCDVGPTEFKGGLDG